MRISLSLFAEPGAPCLLSFIWISPCVVFFVNPAPTRAQGNRNEKSRRAKRPDGKTKKPLRRNAGRAERISMQASLQIYCYLMLSAPAIIHPEKV
jgi:hypothetical protein